MTPGIAAAAFLGLLGFVEPCTVGSSVLFVKYLQGKSAAAVKLEAIVFAGTRALVLGGLGVVAALAGRAILPYQRGFWIGLGVLYGLVGTLYLSGHQRLLARRLGPKLGRAPSAAAVGLLFGLNIPACATPLLAVLFAANLGAANIARGFWTMGIFGLALSFPLVLAVYSARAREALVRLASYADQVPRWTGTLLIVLGAWSIFTAIK
ncbi:MAG: cytochrome c biogenesis protein CcdA [Gemmatimonadaceae bacterium]